MTKNKLLNILVPSILAIGSALLIVHSYLNPVKINFDTLGTYGIPRFILWLVIVLSVFDIIKEVIDFFREKKHNPVTDVSAETTKQLILPLKSVIAMASIIIYFFLWEYIGFSISTVLLVAINSKILSPKTQIWRCILVGFGTMLICNLVFVFAFSISLPDPVLEWILYR